MTPDLNLSSSDIFEQIVRKHVGWVSAVARRRLGDSHLADDVTQAVFILLHRKAPRFAGEGALVKWLHQSACHMTRNAIRSQKRRRNREHAAYLLQQQQYNSASSPEWMEIAPILDELILKLNESEREVILLRYYQQLTFADIGALTNISEDAARKRSDRAIEKLKTLVQAKGLTISAAAISTAMLSNVAPTAKAGTVSVVLAGATGSAGSAINISSTSLIGGTLFMFNMKQIIGFAILAILLLLAGSLFFFNSSKNPTDSLSASTTSTAPSIPLQADMKIKVGVLFSEFTATGPTWIDAPYGHWWPAKIVREELRDRQLDLYPIIDPGSAKTNQIPEMCSRYFPGKSPIECNDPVAMSQMQVFVATGQANLTPEMIAGLTKAVKDDGKGLIIRMFFGGTTPSYTPEVQALLGLTDADYGFGGNRDVEVEVIANHPILSDWPVGSTLKIQANGVFGLIVKGMPLIKLKEASDVRAVHSENSILPSATHEFYPMYVSELGKGKIIHCAWSITPKESSGRNPSAIITPRAIKWLAESEKQ